MKFFDKFTIAILLIIVAMVGYAIHQDSELHNTYGYKVNAILTKIIQQQDKVKIKPIVIKVKNNDRAQVLTDLINDAITNIPPRTNHKNSIVVDCYKNPLACTIYFEARNQTLQVQAEVGMSVINRMFAHNNFGDTLKDVVYKPAQFSWNTGKQYYKITEVGSWLKSLAIAKMLGNVMYFRSFYRYIDLTNGATYFHTKTIHPSWDSIVTKTISDGAFNFYIGN